MTRDSLGRFTHPPAYVATHDALRQACRERMIDEAVRRASATFGVRAAGYFTSASWRRVTRDTGMVLAEECEFIRSEFQRLANRHQKDRR